MAGFRFPKRKTTTDCKPDEIIVSRTFNNGDFESTKIQLRVPVQKTDDLDVVFDVTMNRILQLRQNEIKNHFGEKQ